VTDMKTESGDEMLCLSGTPAFDMRNGSLADYNGVPGYIYMMRKGSAVKIGKSLCPRNRLKSFKTGAPEIELLREWMVFDMGESEKILHKRYAPAIDGTKEWFSLQEPEVEFLRALDDWSFEQFVCSPANYTSQKFKETAAWRRLESQHYVWHILFNPHTILELCTAGQMPSREQLQEIYQRDPIGFLATCRLLVVFKVNSIGNLMLVYENLETRSALTGGKLPTADKCESWEDLRVEYDKKMREGHTS
jgi:hypothetical protein